MQVIGITEAGEGHNKQKAYVAIVSHHELQKVADKARYEDRLPELKVGQDYPLSEGYDFRGQLSDAIKKMEEAYMAFAKIAPVAAQFAGIVSAKEPTNMKIGGKYNWKHQPERLVYKGKNFSGNGYWHQFAKVESPGVVWCEVLDSDLHMLEETRPTGATHDN